MNNEYIMIHKFQQKLKEYENKRISDENIVDLMNDYAQEKDKLFLIKELKENYHINQYYTRNLYEIIEKGIENKNFTDVDNFCTFLENNLKNIETLSSLNRDIFIKLYLKLTGNTQNVKKLYDEFIEKKYINISTIEDFTEYFLNSDENIYFIKAFLYDKKGWFRGHYYDYQSGVKKQSQDKILGFSPENLELFFDELNKKENISTLLHEINSDKENNFITNFIKKATDNGGENKLYNFLVSQIQYHGTTNEYYSKNAFFSRNIKLFNALKNKGTLNYQQFFTDINYGQPGYYYYSEFEHFIFQTIENQNDLENIAKLKELEEKDYFIRNGYFYVKYNLKDEEKAKLFEVVFSEQIQIFEEQRKKAVEENKKYEDENDKEILDEIKENLEKAKDTEHKLFAPKFLEDFINKFDYQLRVENEAVIHEKVKNQLNYFFTWKNLDITTPDILSKFQKTKTGYHAPSFMHDGTFGIVFQSAQKIGFDLSLYKNRLAGFYPFQWKGENLEPLKNYFGIDELKQIINIYKNYPAIRGYQSYNIIYLFQEKYEREGIENNQFFQEVKKDNELKNDVISILQALNTDENFAQYYLKDSLELLFQLGVEKSYFQALEGTKPSKNYFKNILQSKTKDDEFKKYLIINEFLIKNQDKDAFLWRIDQLLNGFMDIPIYDFEDGEARYIGDLEDEIDSHYFIKVLGEFKNIDEKIEEKIIELIELSFQEYDNYKTFSKYIWNAVKYYLKDLSKDLEYNKKLVDKITDLLSKSTDVNKNIAFKNILGEISDKFLSKVEKEEIVKKHIDRIKELEEENINLKKKLDEFISHNIEIYTEGKTDWKHLVRAWYELERQGKLNTNNVNKNIIDYLIKYEDIDKKIGGADNIYKFLNTYALLHTKKLIIGLFDTDNGEPTSKVSLKNEDNYVSDKNLFFLYLHNPHNNERRKIFYEKGICIECYYNKNILEKYNFILRENSSEMGADLLSNIGKNKFIYTKEIKNTLILDGNWKNKNIYDKNLNKIENINKIFSKNQFAEDIAHDYLEDRKNKPRHNSFYKEPNIKTWDRFLPIFISLTKIIEEWEKKLKKIFKIKM